MATKTAKKMTIRPLGDRVVVRPLEAADQMKGGLYIPDTAKERPQEGEIVAVGAGKLDKDGNRMELDVKVGDRVLFGKYAGTEITVNDDAHLIMHEDDILAVL